MDHAEAHEYIADLALEPGRLRSLASAAAPADVALRAHVARCQRCAAELAAWESVQAGIAGAVDQAGSDELRRIAAPSDLRRAVLASAHTERGNRRVVARLPRLSLRLGATALALTLVAAGVIVVVDQAARLNASNADRQALAGALQTATQVLTDPAHQVITLSAPDGTASGTFAWTRRDLVVLATGLVPPAEGQVYRCWVLASGGDTPVGQMDFVDGEAFWVGALDDWAAVDLRSAGSFAVTVEPFAGGTTRTGPIVLEGSLGG
jgi:hypothetical protein